MKRRNAEIGKMRRPMKKSKITEGFYGSSTLLYLKFVVLWLLVILADFILEFRFEFLWPFYLLLRSVYDSFKYQGLAFSIFFVCIALTSDMLCFFFIPVHWLFFVASTYVWVQYVWHTDKGICTPTIILWLLFVYLEAAVRLKDVKHLPGHLDLCRPFAAHCIGYPVVTLGFRFKSYIGYRIRQRKQRDVAKEHTLLEHYLHVWSTLENCAEKNKLTQKILKLLQNPDIKYEEQKLYQQILRYHISKNDANYVLTCCRRFGHQEPTLWVQALWSCVRDTQNPSMDVLNEILTVISKEKLFSPQLVVDAVATGNAEITLGHIRQYITNELKQEQKKIKEISELTSNYRKDTDKLKTHLNTLKSGLIVIQGSRCAACHHPLELPTIHFLCQHSFHQHCFQSFSDDENECPTCQPENKNLLDLLKAREYNKDLHEIFHSQLEKAHDCFEVAAEYFGRGVFNKYKVITDETMQKNLTLPDKVEVVVPKKMQQVSDIKNYGPGAEARMRQTEHLGNNKTNKIMVPVAEGRMRIQEQRYSSSLEANMIRYTEKKQSVKNPFDDEYDQTKNPFANDDDDELDDTNPFREDYDKNLNPFS